MTQTVTKTYDNLKAAHRQWRHEGHCHFVHGENWTFHITFSCGELDELGFVVDFGKLKGLKAIIDKQFDHVLLIDEDDPEVEFFKDMHKKGLTDLRLVPSASAEGLCRYVFDTANNFIGNETNGRVWVCEVVAEEDKKNTATLTDFTD